MNNNDILRSIRYTFNLTDEQMVKIFGLADVDVTLTDIDIWLKKDDDPGFKSLYDKQLAIFLNGFINFKRGKREGVRPTPEKTLNNNIILRKLKIALNLKDFDILDILKQANLHISKHELSAFFRKPGQDQYRLCKDQVLRNFLKGLTLKYHKRYR